MEGSQHIRTERKYLILKKYIYPTYETTIRIRNISEVIVNDKAHIVLFTFNEYAKINNGYRLMFNEDMYIDLICGGEPKGEIIDKKVPDKHTYVTTLLFMDFGNRTK